MSRMRPGPRGEGFRWTREAVVQALDSWHSSHLRAPRAHEWARAGEEHPSSTTVFRVFGSWSAALHAAGMIPGRPGGAVENWARPRRADGRFLPREATS